MNSKHLVILALLGLSSCNGRQNYTPYDGTDAATLRLYNNSAGHLMVSAYKDPARCTGTRTLTPMTGQQQFDMKIPANTVFNFSALLELHPELRVTESGRQAGHKFYTFTPKAGGFYEFVIEAKDPQWSGSLFERDPGGRFLPAPYQLAGGGNCR